MKLTPIQLKRWSGALTRKRAPAPRPTVFLARQVPVLEIVIRELSVICDVAQVVEDLLARAADDDQTLTGSTASAQSTPSCGDRQCRPSSLSSAEWMTQTRRGPDRPTNKARGALARTSAAWAQQRLDAYYDGRIVAVGRPETMRHLSAQHRRFATNHAAELANQSADS